MSRILLTAVVGLAAGCAPVGPQPVTVSGTVTYNGEPVGQGDILFVDPLGAIPAGGGRVTNGRYEFLVLPGTKRVEVRGSRSIPGTSNPMRGGGPDVEELIPAEFYRNSKLTAEVTPDGPNTFDFPLTGMPPKK